MKDLELKRSRLEVLTDGFLRSGMPEVRISVDVHELLPECENFLQFVGNYVSESGRKIKAGETLNYGYWLVKFQAVNEKLLDVWEYNAEGTEFVPGGSLTMRYWRDQHQVCAVHHAEFKPPRPDKLTAVSAGVLEGLPVQGVRYPWREHMSGWLLVTDQWDNDIKSLTNHHTYHVTATRPDLAKFFALPVGFRFSLNNGQKIWLDDDVVNQLPI